MVINKKLFHPGNQTHEVIVILILNKHNRVTLQLCGQ